MPPANPIDAVPVRRIDDLRLLLQGCRRDLLGAAVLAAGSGLLDIACMVVLPVYLMYALSAGQDLRLPVGMAALVGQPSPAALTAGVALLFVLRGAFALYVGAQFAARAQAIRARIVLRLADAYAQAPFERAVTRSVSDGLTAAAAHSQFFADNAVLALMRLGLDVTTLLAVLLFLLAVEPGFMLGTGAVLGVIALLNFTLVRRTNDHNARQQTELENALSREVSQLLTAPREVRILDLGSHVRGRLASVLHRTIRVRAWFGAVYWLPRVLGELTLIGLAAAFLLLKEGADAQTMISSLGLLAYAGIRLLPAFAQTLAGLSMLRAAAPAAHALAGLLREADVNPAAPADTAPPGTPFHELELQRVSVRYPGAGTDALLDVDLRLRAGEALGLLGPSGSGKSTLADLMLGLLAPTAGSVRIDGRDVSLRHPAWRRRVGFVAQVPFVADDTVFRNVAFGVPDAEVDLPRVEWALREARLDGAVAALPGGLHATLGERGGRLSGGQRQRLAIARALYRRCELLVLDEATSALDPATEREVIEAIGRLRGTVTMVVIAHRRETLAACDRILQVRQGRVGPE